MRPRRHSLRFFLGCVVAAISIACGPQQVHELNALDYGAIADGATDSTASIQQSIDAAAAVGGGRVVIPAAPLPYLVSGTLSIRAGGIELDGTGARILLADNSPLNDAPVLQIEGEQDEPIHDVLITGLTLDANFFAQDSSHRPRGIELRYAVGARIVDVTITRVYVGLDFGRGCVDGEALRVTITDYEEDAFDAGGDSDVVSGGTSQDIRFIDVVARDAPRGDAGGNAFEIEDGARGVLIQNALVENVSGNGFGLRNHNTPGNQNHSRDIELRDVTIRNIAGEFAGFGRSAPREEAAENSYRDIRLVNVRTESPVAFYGPIEGLEIEGGDFGHILLGFDHREAQAIPGLALKGAAVKAVKAERIRVNGSAGEVVFSGIPRDAVSIEGADAMVAFE